MAGRIPSSFVDGLIANSDIVEVIGRFVPLQKKGHEYMACCPFHDEKTPSFSVSPSKQFYYCFGCGAGGSVVKFLMSYRKMDFVEAVETLAQFAGVEVPRESGGAPEDNKQRKQTLAVLAQTFELYRKNLVAIPTATEYLARRGIDENTATVFGLGYAPDGYDNLKRHFGTGYDEQMLLRAGLLAQKPDTTRTYDKFRHRLMFPIRDRRGRVIAFGGRVLKNEDQPKYLNSPETEVFNKRRTLYGAYEIKGSGRLDQIIVVEGYMDVVSLYAHGVKNAVATLGTAVTQEHMRQLFRLCDRLVFCFDGDLAGRKAAARALEQALALSLDGRSVSFTFLPEGEDPDSFVRAHGKEALEKTTTEATPLSVFLFDHLSHELDLGLPEGCAAFAERARPMLASMPRGTFRDLVTAELAGRAGVETGHLAARKTARRPQPLRAEYKSRLNFSPERVAIARLLLDPSLASLANCDKLRKLDRPGGTLLVDMITRIRQNPGIKTAALLEHYRDSKYEKALIRLLKDWQTLTGEKTQFEKNAPTEFEDSMQHLYKLLQEQAPKNPANQTKARTLSEEDKEQVRKHLERLDPHHSAL